MKKTDYRTKNKQRNEANDSEADQLIKEYLDKNYHYRAKVKELLEDYLEDNKDKESHTNKT